MWKKVIFLPKYGKFTFQYLASLERTRRVARIYGLAKNHNAPFVLYFPTSKMILLYMATTRSHITKNECKLELVYRYSRYLSLIYAHKMLSYAQSVHWMNAYIDKGGRVRKRPPMFTFDTAIPHIRCKYVVCIYIVTKIDSNFFREFSYISWIWAKYFCCKTNFLKIAFSFLLVTIVMSNAINWLNNLQINRSQRPGLLLSAQIKTSASTVRALYWQYKKRRGS